MYWFCWYYESTSKNCSATHCNTLQHTATHCNTLQHASVDSAGTTVVPYYEPFSLAVLFFFDNGIVCGCLSFVPWADDHIYINTHTNAHTHTETLRQSFARVCALAFDGFLSFSLPPFSVCNSHHHGEHFLSAIRIIMENNDKSYINRDNSYINEITTTGFH